MATNLKEQIKKQLMPRELSKFIAVVMASAEPYRVIDKNYDFINSVKLSGEVKLIERLNLTILNVWGKI